MIIERISSVTTENLKKGSNKRSQSEKQQQKLQSKREKAEDVYEKEKLNQKAPFCKMITEARI